MLSIESSLARLHLGPQQIHWIVVVDGKTERWGKPYPWGDVIDVPPEALLLGRLLLLAPEDDRVPELLLNLTRWGGGNPRTTLEMNLAIAWHSLYQEACKRALSRHSPHWAAIALGAASLTRFGNVQDPEGMPDLKRPEWRTAFGPEVAAFAEDLADGLVEWGSERLRAMMRRVAGLGASKPPGARSVTDRARDRREPAPNTEEGTVLAALRKARGNFVNNLSREAIRRLKQKGWNIESALAAQKAGKHVRAAKGHRLLRRH